MNDAADLAMFKVDRLLQDLFPKPDDAKSIFGLLCAQVTWHTNCEHIGSRIAEECKPKAEALIARLEAADESETIAFLSALGRQRMPDTLPLFVRYLENESEYVRATAVKAIGRLKNAEGFQPLLERLHKEPDSGVRVEIGDAIRTLGIPPGSVDIIRQLGAQGSDRTGKLLDGIIPGREDDHLAEFQREFRASSLEALAGEDGDDVLELMLVALQDESQLVVQVARRWFEARLPRHLDRLIANVDVKGRYGREAVARVLVRVKDSGIEPVLCNALERCKNVVVCRVLAKRLAVTKSERTAAALAGIMRRNAKTHEPILSWVMRKRTSVMLPHLKELCAEGVISRWDCLRALLAIQEKFFHETIDAWLAGDNAEDFAAAAERVNEERMLECLPAVAEGFVRLKAQLEPDDVRRIREYCRDMHRRLQRLKLPIPVSLAQRCDELMARPEFQERGEN